MRLPVWFAAFLLLLSPAGLEAANGPGRVDVPLIAGQIYNAGTVTIHNDNGGLLIDVQTANGWKLVALQVHPGWEGWPVPMRSGNPVPGKFRFKYTYAAPAPGQRLWFDFAVDLQGFRWGAPYEPQRTRHIAVHADVVLLDDQGRVIASEGAWALGDHTFTGGAWGWWLEYLMSHKARAHFVDSPVQGIRAVTPTTDTLTDAAGGFDYFPGEIVQLFLGSQVLGTTEADHRLSPVDLFGAAGIDDARVVNMGRLLQSLDADANPKAGITITPDVLACFETAVSQVGWIVDWYDTAQVDRVISSSIAACDGQVALASVSAEDAAGNIEKSLSSNMFRKNVSKTPELLTAKSKIDVMPVLVPALRANGEPADDVETAAVGVDYYDDNGEYLYTREKVHPLVAVYADQDPVTGAHDTWGAVSRDDGATWKRMNLSRAADRSSFLLANGQAYYGDVKKPNLAIKENYALAVWQSKFCRGGRPRYSLDETSPYYVDDIWGVGGPQRSHDYTEDGYPEVGELPFYCLWIARGTVDPATGDIAWRKPERLTSGRRDVYQVAVNGAKGAGFGIVWQEDPEGVRPGEMAGPGHGWSGATTNHKTDIWYSYISWADFATIDTAFVPNGDPEHSFDDPEWTTSRPMPLVPFSLPMRLSDNDVCNSDNMKVVLDETTRLPIKDAEGRFVPINDPLDPEWDGKHAGTHRYAYLLDGNGNNIPDLCANFHTFVNSQGVTKHVCITEDGRLLDGDTGASRPNISFMPYTRPDGTPSAWVAIVYEETKGVGSGRIDWDDDEDTTHEEEKAKADLGKNVIYHSFEFGSPVRVSGGDIVNLPARDAAGNLLYLVDALGQRMLDWQGLPQLAYENARRPRMLVQPPGQAGTSGTVMVLVYKQGEDGKGRPSDIFLRRVKKAPGGNPYAFANFVCKLGVVAENGQRVCLDGALNMSSVTPMAYWTNPDQDDQAKGEGIKVVKYEQYVTNLADASWSNPYDDARAHRGILRGNNVFLAYDYTPNWAASRNAHDKYDLFIRRSFDGGQSWTTDPLPVVPEGQDPLVNNEVCHTRIWKDYTAVSSEEESSQKPTYEETVCFGPGVFEPARNMSMLKNNKLSVIEPRLVGPPGTTPGSPYPEDVTNPNVYYVTFGTATNVPKPHGSDDDEEEEAHAVPADLFYTFTRDRGQVYFKRLWEVNPDSDGNYAGQVVERYDYLAKGDAEQGEAQIRMSPDGSKFYAVWNEEGLEGSDTWFRRIMSAAFPQNLGTPVVPVP